MNPGAGHKSFSSRGHKCHHCTLSYCRFGWLVLGIICQCGQPCHRRAAEEHLQLRIVRNFTKHICGREGELRSPEVVFPGRPKAVARLVGWVRTGVGPKTCLQEAKARRLLQRRLQLSCFDQENAVWIEGVGAVPGMKWWNWNVMIELVRSEIKHEGWTDSDAFSLKRFGPLWQSQLKVLTDQLFVSIAIWKHL